LTRRVVAIAVTASIAAAGVAAFLVIGRREELRGTGSALPAAPRADRVDAGARARLEGVPFYQGLLRSDALQAASLEADGTVDVEVDLPALLRPRLARSDLAALLELMPRTARGAIRIQIEGPGRGAVRDETWIVDGSSPLLDLLSRSTRDPVADAAWEAIPGAPTAVASARVLAARLADPAFGGSALATWRERAEIAEHVLGRPLRAEIADDLAGPVVVALYDASATNQASALLVVELRRSDRLRTLLDSVFALGALTERATVRRYRDVATGSFRPAGDGPGLAVAVDGPLLLAASSRVLLEAAIDARRGARLEGGLVDEVRRGGGSWNAVSTSSFVAHGWARLARVDDVSEAPRPPRAASLTPEGATGWRLVGRGPGPAVTADPVLPFLRSAFAGRQRGAG
jgi:hypothetical protein